MSGRPTIRALLALVALAATLAISGSAFGQDPPSLDPRPSPEALPAGTVAIVDHVSEGSRAITTAALTHAIAQTAAEAGLRTAPTPAHPKYKGIEKEALGQLLDGLWIQGQAAEMRIFVSKRQVSAELAQIKKDSFKTERQFRAFLKHAHLTLLDVRNRVRLQLLATKIQERVAGTVWDEENIPKVFKTFVAAYQKRWRARTICAPQYVIERCANG